MSPGLDRIHIRNSRSIPVNRERKLDPAGATARRSDPEGPEARTGTRDCPWSRCPPACERPQDRTHYRPSLGSGPWKSKLLGHPCSVSAPPATPNMPGHSSLLGPFQWDSPSATGERPIASTSSNVCCPLLPLKPSCPLQVCTPRVCPPSCHCSFHVLPSPFQTTSSAELVLPSAPSCSLGSPSSCLSSSPPFSCPYSFPGTLLTQMTHPVPSPCVSPRGSVAPGVGQSLLLDSPAPSTVIATSKVPTHFTPRG